MSTASNPSTSIDACQYRPESGLDDTQPLLITQPVARPVLRYLLAGARRLRKHDKCCKESQNESTILAYGTCTAQDAFRYRLDPADVKQQIIPVTCPERQRRDAKAAQRARGHKCRASQTVPWAHAQSNASLLRGCGDATSGRTLA